MHRDLALVERRWRRTLGRLRPAVHAATAPLTVGMWTAPGEPVPVADGLAAPYEPVDVGVAWGAAWDTVWFRLTGTVPDAFAGRAVEAVVDLGFAEGQDGFTAEGLVHRADGSPVKGLHPRSRWVHVSDAADAGAPVEWYVEAAANPMFLGGGGRDFTPTQEGDRATASRVPLYRLVAAHLAVLDRDVWDLVQDLEVVGELQAELDPGDARRWQLVDLLDRAMDAVDAGDLAGSAAAARAVLAPAFAAPARASAHAVTAVGHAHIDSAWLWPTRETVRKVARTCASVTDLMDRDPSLVHAMSSAQQFAWLQEHRPGVFARVRDRVADGRFVPVGGMWVESDTNLPGGEALARQLAHGKRWFLDTFGVETREVWLPDSFGYTAALPQLIALSRSRWFLTQKISWNTTNRFPHHTFRWEGLDGTQVFTHFPPMDTYNSVLSGAELAHAARNFAEKGRASGSLALFGLGDGGGGPTREMLARAARLRDVDGSPTVRIDTPAAFFARAEAEYPDAPVWVGELYLEFHRGTYTSQALTKQGNRRNEHLLREAELWAATAAVRHGAPYPYDALDRIWKLVLLQQFHDILPGSSIHWVHREAVANHAAVTTELEALVAAAQAVLAGTGAEEITFDAAPHARDGVPAMGAAPRTVDASTSVTADGADTVLDNGILRVVVDARGLLTGVRDLVADREVLAPGSTGNLLQLHPDTPNVFDAWDIDEFYRHRVTDLVDVEAVEPAPDGVRVRRAFGRSTVVQTITLPPGHRRVDVDTMIDWRERESLLKVAFDVDVAAATSAAETQFGHVRRATHTNTTWDAARFEICAHRWIHVGEDGYGVAVVNDSTYGHDVTRRPRAGGGTTTCVRLSLLRAPLSPDPVTDQGEHRLRYSLVPGATVQDAVREGYRINLPPRHVRGSGAPVRPLVDVDTDAVVVESVKLADDRSGDLVVRLYEALGGRRRARLTLPDGFTDVTVVDLLERPLTDDPAAAPVPELPLDGADGADGAVGFELGPFRVVTLRFAGVGRAR